MLKKLWRIFFSPGPEKILSPELLDSTEQMQVSINTRAYEQFLPNVTLELIGKKNLTLSFGFNGKEGRWDVWENGNWGGGKFGSANPKMFSPLWLFTHLCLKESFAPLKVNSLSPVSGQTSASLQEESRGLQWIQTSFRVLEAALQNCGKNFDQMIVAGFKASHNSLSLQIFNLDINVIFNIDGIMSVIIFDDKNHGQGSAKTPSLEVGFATLKPAVLDELIKIVALTLSMSENRYQ